MVMTDEDAAVAAISALDPLSPAQVSAQAAIASTMSHDDPFVDILELFSNYDVLYFRSLLASRVKVTWSPRLTLCAGICELVKDPATGKYTLIRLKLSEPLLKYRPRSDLIDTLLHECIHAYFFITTSWRHARADDGTGHGSRFLLLADAINNHGCYSVTVYHTFHDEVDSYRTHVWQVNTKLANLRRTQHIEERGGILFRAVQSKQPKQPCDLYGLSIHCRYFSNRLIERVPEQFSQVDMVRMEAPSGSGLNTEHSLEAAQRNAKWGGYGILPIYNSRDLASGLVNVDVIFQEVVMLDDHRILGSKQKWKPLTNLV
ncbi:hypothetical protein MBLNU459_g2853t1 [Dothideomycetes sp. NU459]